MTTFDLLTLQSREVFEQRFADFHLVSYMSISNNATRINRPSDWLLQAERQVTQPEKVLALEHFASCQDKLVLFDFRADKPGTAGSVVQNVQRLPRFAVEVEPFSPLGEDDHALRLAMAKATGFLLVLPGETVAVSHQNSEGLVFVDGVTCDENGHARTVTGLYADNLPYKVHQKCIRELDATAAEKLLGQTYGAMLYLWDHLSDQERNLHKLQIKLLEAHIPQAPDERKPSGAVIRRTFIEGGNTGSTCDMRPVSEGWVRYPTWQDAWYFGVWVNPRKLEVLTYAEQDVTHVVCETAEQFQLELKDLAEFYGKSLEPCAKAYAEDGSITAFFDSLSFREGKYKTVSFLDNQGERLAILSKSHAPLMLDVDTKALQAAADASLRLSATSTLKPCDFSMNVLDPRSFAHEYHLQVKALTPQVVELTLWAAPDLLLSSTLEMAPAAVASA